MTTSVLLAAVGFGVVVLVMLLMMSFIKTMEAFAGEPGARAEEPEGEAPESGQRDLGRVAAIAVAYHLSRQGRRAPIVEVERVGLPPWRGSDER